MRNGGDGANAPRSENGVIDTGTSIAQVIHAVAVGIAEAGGTRSSAGTALRRAGVGQHVVYAKSGRGTACAAATAADVNADPLAVALIGGAFVAVIRARGSGRRKSIGRTVFVETSAELGHVALGGHRTALRRTWLEAIRRAVRGRTITELDHVANPRRSTALETRWLHGIRRAIGTGAGAELRKVARTGGAATLKARRRKRAVRRAAVATVAQFADFDDAVAADGTINVHVRSGVADVSAGGGVGVPLIGHRSQIPMENVF